MTTDEALKRIDHLRKKLTEARNQGIAAEASVRIVLSLDELSLLNRALNVVAIARSTVDVFLEKLSEDETSQTNKHPSIGR